MSDSEEVDDLEHNEPVENMSVFRKRDVLSSRQNGSQLGSDLIEMDAFRKLNNMLTCPICLDLFQEPVYVKDCSHRFCKECIEKAIRSSKTKQCPTCRRVIGTKRLLRIDHNVQDMISSIFGDISQFLEQKQTNEEVLLTQTYNSLANHETNTRKLLKDKQEKMAAEQAAAESGRYQEANSSNRDSNNYQGNQSNNSTNAGNNVNNRVRSKHLKRTGNRNKKASENTASVPPVASNKPLTASQQQQQQQQQAASQNSRKRKKQTSRDKNSSNNNGAGSRKRRHEMYAEEDDDEEEEEEEEEDDEDDRYEQRRYRSSATTENNTRKKQFTEDAKSGQVSAAVVTAQPAEKPQVSKNNDLWDLIAASKRVAAIPGEERVLITLEIKVIPYERLQKQFDFSVCKLDWRLTLNDISKLICAKLLLSYAKYNSFVKLFTKQKADDTFFYPLDEKSSTIKAVDEQFWNMNQVSVTNSGSSHSLYQQQQQQITRVLFYMIELKELPQSL